MKTKKPVEVQKNTTIAGPLNPVAWETVQPTDSTQEAEKWLKDNGQVGETYRIVTIHREGVIAEQIKRTVKLA